MQCGASLERRVPRRFLWSADSLVRPFLRGGIRLADKAVRAPLVATPPRYGFALVSQAGFDDIGRMTATKLAKELKALPRSGTRTIA